MQMLSLFSILFALIASTAQAQPQPGKTNSRPPALIETAPVREGRLRTPQTFIGTAEPRYSTAVASEIEGLVEELAVRRGQSVSKGEVIARLRPYRVNLQLEEARAGLEEVAARIRKAEADLKRAEGLFAQKFISEEELQGRDTELDALRQAARRRRAAIRILSDRLERLTVRAPFAGRVVRESTEVGQWLEEGATVVELVDLSVIHVMIPVPEQHLHKIVKGQKARIALDALAEETFTGEVTEIIPQGDLEARTFPVQVTLANPQARILPGMLTRVTFSSDPRQQSLLVPKDALVPRPDGGGYVVKVVEGAADIVTVRIDSATEGDFAVSPLTGSLQSGDRVVVRGNERLRSGQRVREYRPAAEQ